MARQFGDAARGVILHLIEAQTDPAERAEWARIAHDHGNITDDELAFYEGSEAA